MTGKIYQQKKNLQFFWLMNRRTFFHIVLAGHAHGGQVRLPWIGGIVAPDQGFFPEYTEGLYEANDTSMIVSRGLGNSIIPVRIFNRPEIVCVELGKK